MSAQGSGFTWTRRIVVSFAVVVLSMAGHSAGSAMLPSLLGFLIAVVLTLALTVGVRAGSSPLRLLGLLLGIQALLHVLFVLSADCPPELMSSMTLIPSTGSLVGHLVASLAAVAVLREGDRVLSSWTALFTAAFGAPSIALPAIPDRPALPIPNWDARAFSADAHLTTQVRRGPPSA